MITRGTTPLIILTLPPEMPLTDFADGTFTIAQGRVAIIKKELAEMTPVSEDNSYTFRLTQEEMLSLDRGLTIEAQFKLITTDGVVVASNIIRCSCDDILDETLLELPQEET